MEKGIPDDAFNPIEGDMKTVCAELKRQNKREHQDRERGQGLFEFEPFIQLGICPLSFSRLSSSSDDSVTDLAEKERRYAELIKNANYLNARLLADLWCAVFVWKKDTSDLGKLCPTENDFRKIENNPHSILPHVKSEVRRLANQYQFFHWHLAFPDVFRLPGQGVAENKQTGWNAGFDVVLGNPPWEKVNLQEKEWFSERVPEIARAKTAAKRKELVASLFKTQPLIAEAFELARSHSNGITEYIRNSRVFPLCGRGDINLYAPFAELARSLKQNHGRLGYLVPSESLQMRRRSFSFANSFCWITRESFRFRK